MKNLDREDEVLDKKMYKSDILFDLSYLKKSKYHVYSGIDGKGAGLCHTPNFCCGAIAVT